MGLGTKKLGQLSQGGRRIEGLEACRTHPATLETFPHIPLRPSALGRHVQPISTSHSRSPVPGPDMLQGQSLKAQRL